MNTIKKMLSIILCICCITPIISITSAAEDNKQYIYVVIKKINSENENRRTVATLLRIGNDSCHASFSGKNSILSDTFVMSSRGGDLLNQVSESVKYGDIIEYRGDSLDWTTGTQFNVLILDESKIANDSFEIIGNIFENPTSDVEIKEVNGKSVIAVHPFDGATYLIEQGSIDQHLVDFSIYPNQKGDTNDSNDVNIIDVISLNKYIIGVRSLSESAIPAADMNSDGNINLEDSLALLNNIVS